MPTRIPPRNIAINAMVADLISEVDEDLYKSFFVKEYEEDPVLAKEMRRALRAIVERHLPLIEEAGPPEPTSTATVGTSATVAEATCGNQGGGVGCGGYYGDEGQGGY